MSKKVDALSPVDAIKPMGNADTLMDLGDSIRRFGDVQLGNHLIAHAKAWKGETGGDPLADVESDYRTISGRRPEPGDVVSWKGRQGLMTGLVELTAESVAHKLKRRAGPSEAIRDLGLKEEFGVRFESNNWGVNGAVIRVLPTNIDNPQSKMRLYMPQNELRFVDPKEEKAFRDSMQEAADKRQTVTS